MGLRDSMNRMAAEQTERQQASLEAARQVAESCPDVMNHYDTEVNKGSINMAAWKQSLNRRYQQGYRLAHVYSQDGNTVLVFEHSHP